MKRSNGPQGLTPHWKAEGFDEGSHGPQGVTIGLHAQRLDGVQVVAGSTSTGGLQELSWVVLLPMEYGSDGLVHTSKVALSSPGFLWEALDEVDARWPVSGWQDQLDRLGSRVGRMGHGGLGELRVTWRDASPAEIAERLKEVELVDGGEDDEQG